jgi:signal transduction histidine kinase
VIEQKKENSKIIEFHKNKEEYFFNIIVSLVKDIHQNITSVVVLFQNVTTLKQLERLKTNFVSTISHEFKTPLTSIMIGTSIISDQQIGSLNEKQKDIVNAIIEDSERLSELVTNLLQLSKIQTNEEAYNFSSCSINSIIENCAKAFYEQLSAKDIKLELEVGNKLPKVIADSEKISWVINNLISNALKYTTAGDYIIISAKVKLGEMHILVKDTGMGIPEQYKEKIFDKFVQVVGRDSEIRGSGLGLTISKEIVESHKGHIWCESEEDSGSTFTFTLPLE